MGLSSMVSPSKLENPHFQPPLYGFSYNYHNQLDDLGKPFDRMNLEHSHIYFKNNTGDNSNLISYSNQQQPLGGGGGTSSVNNAGSPSLSSSSSSSSPPTFNFNQRTTPGNEVWKEMVQQDQGNLSACSSNDAFAQRTIEDFLIRNKCFDDDVVVNPQPLATIAATLQPTDWLQYPLVNVQQQQKQHDQQKHLEMLGSHIPITAPPLLANSIVEVAYSDNNLVSSMPMVVAPSPGIQTSDKKRRISDEMMEKTIERRQKRMIKNRESAARSRQRKQDYTNGLEQKVAQLRKENQMLRKEKEQAELFPFQAVTPKHQLRRTSSAKF